MMTDPVEKTVMQVAADVFGLSLEQVSRGLSPESAARWDSVQQLNFLLGIEQALGIVFEPDEFEQIRSVGDAIDVARGKVV